MSKRRELADLSADVVLSRPQVLAKAYRDYHRYSVTLKGDDGPVVQERDVLIAGKVVVVMPIDITRPGNCIDPPVPLASASGQWSRRSR